MHVKSILFLKNFFLLSDNGPCLGSRKPDQPYEWLSYKQVSFLAVWPPHASHSAATWQFLELLNIGQEGVMSCRSGGQRDFSVLILPYQSQIVVFRSLIFTSGVKTVHVCWNFHIARWSSGLTESSSASGLHHLLVMLLFCAGLSLSIINIVAGPALVVHIMIARRLSAITIRKRGKNKAFLLQDVEMTQHTWATQARSRGGERERRAPGVLLYWGQRWGPRVSRAHPYG